KNIIADCIPHIRFFNMSSEKIFLFDDLLPRKLRRDILNYQMKKDYVPNTTMLSPRTGQRHNIDAEFYHKAAKQGNSDAQYNFGYCYQHGIGVEKNAENAVEMYQKAAGQGNASAQFNLGYCYHN